MSHALAVAAAAAAAWANTGEQDRGKVPGELRWLPTHGGTKTAWHYVNYNHIYLTSVD